MKKLIAGLLSVTMAFGAAALTAEESGFTLFDTAVTASADSYGDFEYDVLDDGTVKIMGYSGTQTILRIPAAISNKQVTVLGNNAFDNGSFTEFYIPNGIKSIGKSIISDCHRTAVKTGKIEIRIRVCAD